ncbi:MAG: hypothetical protein RXR08_00875 [Sulfolobaceae archaeon]
MLEVEGNFKYITINGKYVKFAHGERGVLLISMGVTSNKEMTILDITLAKEEDRKSYLELLLQLGRNITSR